ncbi:MAG TPA: amidohydrolase family protein [Steroidobacteraceae bacterium]|nr:amidohydrolase family protein [Steroidobacteraceae bacterium]
MSAQPHIDPPVVDAHAHIFTPEMPLADSAWMRPDYPFTAEDYLRVLDAHGVHFGVIAGISIYGQYNDYMIEALRRSPRLRGTVNIDPTTDRYTLERMKADGVVGVRLQLSRRRELPDLAGESYRLLLRRVADLNWHVHLAVEGPQLPVVLRQLEASPARIVLDHFGHPDPVSGLAGDGFQALLRSVARGRTWVKLSAGYRLTWQSQGAGTPDPIAMQLAQQTAEKLLQEAGSERLLWGSDCPFVGHESSLTYADALTSFAQWVPSAQARRRIGDTALKLYFA